MDLHERLRTAADDSGVPLRTDAQGLLARARTAPPVTSVASV